MGSLDDLSGPARTVEMTRLRKRLTELPIRLSNATSEPHWACPDCEQPCYCVDPLSRRMPHLPCKVAA